MRNTTWLAATETLALVYVGLSLWVQLSGRDTPTAVWYLAFAIWCKLHAVSIQRRIDRE